MVSARSRRPRDPAPFTPSTMVARRSACQLASAFAKTPTKTVSWWMPLQHHPTPDQGLRLNAAALYWTDQLRDRVWINCFKSSLARQKFPSSISRISLRECDKKSLVQTYAGNPDFFFRSFYAEFFAKTTLPTFCISGVQACCANTHVKISFITEKIEFLQLYKPYCAFSSFRV